DRVGARIRNRSDVGRQTQVKDVRPPNERFDPRRLLLRKIGTIDAKRLRKPRQCGEAAVDAEVDAKAHGAPRSPRRARRREPIDASMPTPCHAAATAFPSAAPKPCAAVVTVRTANWRNVALAFNRRSRSVSYQMRPATSQAWPPSAIAVR